MSTEFINEFLINCGSKQIVNKVVKGDTYYDIAEAYRGEYIESGYNYTELCIPLYTVPMKYTCYYYITLSPLSSRRDDENSIHITLYNEDNILICETILYNNLVAVNNIIEGFINLAHQNFISRYRPCLVSNNRPYLQPCEV